MGAINTCLNGGCKTDPSMSVCNCLQNCEVVYNTPSSVQNISGAFGVSTACQVASSKQHLQVPLVCADDKGPFRAKLKATGRV